MNNTNSSILGKEMTNLEKGNKAFKAKNYEDVTEYLEKPVTLEEIQKMVEANPHPRNNVN